MMSRREVPTEPRTLHPHTVPLPSTPKPTDADQGGEEPGITTDIELDQESPDQQEAGPTATQQRDEAETSAIKAVQKMQGAVPVRVGFQGGGHGYVCLPGDSTKRSLSSLWRIEGPIVDQ